MMGYTNEGWRIKIVKRYFHKIRTLFDMTFQKGYEALKTISKYIAKNYVRDSHTGIGYQLKFKCLFMVKDNDVATGL